MPFQPPRSRAIGAVLLALLLLLVPAASAPAFERLGQYGVGSPSGDSGAMILPRGVAVSPSGEVLAVDPTLARVAAFSRDGVFLRATGKNVNNFGAGTCVADCVSGQQGPGAGELGTPWGAAGGSDEVYVADLAHNRISVYGYDGQFKRAFGADVGGPGVNVCTAVCGPGTLGIESGQFAAPAGVALDAGGNLYVTNIGSQRVDVYDPRTGQFLRAFGKDVGGPGVNTCTTSCGLGVADGTPGSINNAFALAVSATGEVFVLESTTSRVSVFDSAGAFVRLFAGPGNGAGQLGSPYGIALDGRGNVFVADSMNNRLAVFGEGGEFRGAYGKDVVPGAPSGAELCTDVCKEGVEGYGAGSFSQPSGVATDCRGAVYVGMVGRIDKWGEPGERTPPCPSNAFSIGAVKKNKKRGTMTVDVTVPGPGTLVAGVPAKLRADVPQPAAAGTLQVTLRADGKGVKALNRKGKLRGTLTLTFTPPNGDPNTQSRVVQLAKRIKKKKKAKKKSKKRGRGKGGKAKGKGGARR